MIPVSEEQIRSYGELNRWREQTLVDYIRSHAGNTPELEALVDPYNRPDLIGGDPKRMTWKTLSDSIDRIAIHLDALGVGKDDVVLIQLPNIVEAPLLYFAIASIGAISSPMVMAARSKELMYALELTRASALVTTWEFNGFNHFELAKELQVDCPYLKNIILVGDDPDNSAINFQNWLEDPIETRSPENYLEGKQSGPNEVFTICWTSGTEADPKAVPRTHNHWIAIADVVVEGGAIEKGHNIHGTFPVINMAGIGGLMVPWILSGGKFVLHHPFDIGVFMKQMMTENLYYTLMPPALLDTLAKSDQVKALGQTSIKVIASGSVPLSPWMVEFYQKELSIGIVNLFGSNEGVALFSFPKIFPNPADRATYFPRIGGEGVQLNIRDDVIAGMETRLVDPASGEVIRETGKPGELYIKGPTVFAGYWNREDLTEKSFDKDGFFKTGDLFSIEGDKMDKYLFHGRYKDLIIRGGQNISPEEVDILIAGHPKVKEACAVGYPDERLGERTCICVVLEDNQTISLEEISRYLDKQGVAKYKYPERIEIMDVLPRNALNKVLRRELKAAVIEKIKTNGEA